MHGIHHSQVEAEASSNYSVVLPVWDRLHRTLRLNVPQRLLTIGVPAYASPGDNGLLAVLPTPSGGSATTGGEPLAGRPDELVV